MNKLLISLILLPFLSIGQEVHYNGTLSVSFQQEMDMCAIVVHVWNPDINYWVVHDETQLYFGKVNYRKVFNIPTVFIQVFIFIDGELVEWEGVRQMNLEIKNKVNVFTRLRYHNH